MRSTLLLATGFVVCLLGCGGDDDVPAAPSEASSLVGEWSGSITYERGMFVGESSSAVLDITSQSESGAVEGAVTVEGETYAMEGEERGGGNVVMTWNDAEFDGAIEGSGPDAWIAGPWMDLDEDGSAGTFEFSRP